MAQGKRTKDPVEPGKRYDRLTVVSKDHTDENGNSFWLCQCDCGNTKIVRSGLLTWNQTRSCGCLYNETRGEQKRLPSGVAVANHLYAHYKRAAERRGYSFDLTKEEFLFLTKQNCYYCGKEPSQTAKSEYDTGDYVYNGIDRLDNSIGYTNHNSVACCGDCNQMKSNRSFDDFLNRIRDIYQNRIRKDEENGH